MFVFAKDFDGVLITATVSLAWMFACAGLHQQRQLLTSVGFGRRFIILVEIARGFPWIFFLTQSDFSDRGYLDVMGCSAQTSNMSKLCI